MDFKKIMVITPHTPSLIWFRMEMMVDFLNRGYEVIAVGEESEETWKEYFGKYEILYRMIPIVRNSLNPFHDFRTIKAIKSLYRELRPQKVFLYQAKAVVYGSIAARQLPNIEIYSLISGLGSVFRGISWKQQVLKTALKYEYCFALKSNKAVIFHNRDDMQQFQSWKIIPSSLCRLVHGSGVNTDKFSFEELPNGPIAFLMIARIIRDKGVMEYLEACKIIKQKYPDTKCMLVGAFDTNPSAIKKELLEPYYSYVDYYGEQKDVKPFIRKCSVYVLPSYHEGVPKSVLEAMSMGRAIITTDVPGCRETVINEENGFLVPAKDHQKLAERMEYMILHPELQQTMGKKSRAIVLKTFDVKKVNCDIAKIMHLEQKEHSNDKLI